MSSEVIAPVNHDPSDALPPQRPWYARINFRLIIFLLVVSAPFVWIIGSAVRNSMNGGVVDYGDFKQVDLRQLGNFSFNEETGTEASIPAAARELDGQRVTLRGFAFQRNSAADTGKSFEFVYNITQCCFNGPPRVQERVFGYSKTDINIPDSSVFAELTGVLHVRVIRDKPTEPGKPGRVVSVFDLDVESLQPVPG